MEKDQKKLKTTPLGQAVNTVMMEQFPNIVDVKFSADMEKKLDVVEAGQADWVKTIDDFYQGFDKSLEQAEKNMEGKRIKVEDIPTDEICEKCGRPMVIKSGRYGKFVACSGFPECRNAHPLVKDTGGLCPLVRRPHAGAQERQGPRLLRLQQLPQVQLYDLGRACARKMPPVRQHPV